MQSKHISHIQEKVKEAMADSCNDILEFTGYLSRKIKTEYLLTVNVAKAIARLNIYPPDPYIIILEQGTRKFARDCLLPRVSGHPLKRDSTIIREYRPQIEREGRIDIAIYIDVPNNKYFGKQPLCAIELKAFNPQRTLVIKDLKRNLEYFRLSGNTGRSVIEFTLFAALHSYIPHENVKESIGNELKTKAKYESWLSELGYLDDIHIVVDTFTVRKELIGEVYNEDDYKVVDTGARHHFVGIIVCFSRKDI